jgi:hypothetical protein
LASANKKKHSRPKGKRKASRRTGAEMLIELGRYWQHGNLREKLPDIRDVKITGEGCWRAGLALRPWDAGDLKLIEV